MPDACEFPGRLPKFCCSMFSNGEKILYVWLLNLKHNLWLSVDKFIVPGDPLIMLKGFLTCPFLLPGHFGKEEGCLFLESTILIDAHGTPGKCVMCVGKLFLSRGRYMIFIQFAKGFWLKTVKITGTEPGLAPPGPADLIQPPPIFGWSYK